MQHGISTIGYEGSAIEAFVSRLQADAITLLIDVRDLPLSRKKGFSKNQLAENLGQAGIAYIHLRGLGDPKPGREAARAGQFGLFRKIFSEHLCSEAAQADLAKAADLVRRQKSCLMCYEADASQCHRSIVASELATRTGLTVNAMVVHDSWRARIAA